MRIVKLVAVALLLCVASVALAQTQAMKKVEPHQATYFSASEMAAAFSKGATLIDQPGLNFRASTGRRDQPGQVEVHTGWTDLIYITEGAATFVTGGKMINGKTTAPGEMRGDHIEGGEVHHLEKGALIIIPAGVPHWFKSIESPVVDYVVKVQKQ